MYIIRLMSSPIRRSASKAIRKQANELRKEMPTAEVKLWSILQNRQLGDFKFRRQHPIGSFIVDFYCPEANLVIEIDGPSHADQTDKDLMHTQWLEEQGLQVLRITNHDVYRNINAVTAVILAACMVKPSKK